MTRDNNKIVFFLLVCFLFISPNQLQARDLKELNPPKPKKEAVEFEAHGIVRTDEYYWMRDDTRKNQEVINHLKSENKYLEEWFKADLDQRDELFEEITSRIPKKKIPSPFLLEPTSILGGMNQIMNMPYMFVRNLNPRKKR